MLSAVSGFKATNALREARFVRLLFAAQSLPPPARYRTTWCAVADASMMVSCRDARLNPVDPSGYGDGYEDEEEEDDER